MSSEPTTSRRHYQLGVNSYDRASSMLVSLLIMVGVIVLGLVIIFFARRLMMAQVAIPVQAVEVASRPADAAMGLKRDIEPPGIEEAPDLQEPKLQDTLSALSELSDRAALLSDEALDADAEASRGRGLGDSRQAGAGGEGDLEREPQREIRFKPDTIAEYAQYLDFFKIELGVLGSDNRVHYAYNLSKSNPDTRVGDPQEDKRLWMNSAGSPSAALDRQLVEKAGLSQVGSIVLQFYPPETQAILFGREQQRAGNRSLEQIRRTVFRVTRKGAAFEFSVESQDYY